MKLGTLCAAVLAGALLASPALAEDKIKILSGPTSGVWYVGMGAVGKAVSAVYPEIKVNLLPGGGLSNPLRLEKGEGDLSLATHSIAVSAAKGLEPYKKAVTGNCSLYNLSDISRMHVVSCSDRGYTSFAEIRDKKLPVRLAVGPIGSGGEVWTRWVLGCYGFSFDDIRSWGGKVITQNWDDATNMIKDGQVDIITWFGPGEVWFLVELSKNIKLTWMSIDQDVQEKMAEQYGVKPHVVPADMYGGAVGEGVSSIADSAELIVRADLSDDMAYKLARAITEKREDIGLAMPGWATMDPATAWKDLAFPLHPGAERYFREIGAIK